MPIITGLIANLWKAAPKAHYRFYPLCSQEIYSIHKLNERVNRELDYKRQAVLCGTLGVDSLVVVHYFRHGI